MAVSLGTSTQNQMTENEMATDVKKYHVVQFLELPYKDIKKYVCVPTSWILLWNVDDEEVRVAYPIEDPAITKKRVENEERVGSSWESYLAVIKYSSGRYDTADFWIDTTPPWNDALGDIPLVISIDDSSTDDPGVIATESNTTLMESPRKLGTLDAADVESKPSDISQQNDSNYYGNVPQKEAMKNNLTLLSPKKEIDDKPIKEEKIDPEYGTTDDWCNRIQIQEVTGTCNTENDSETADNEKYSDIETRPSNEKDITSAIPTSHIQVQEAPKRINKERICVVSEAYLFQGKKETGKESNDNDLSSPQNSPENKSAVQTLIDFVNKKKSDLTPHVQGVPTLIVNETLKPHTQTLDGSEANHIWHKSHPENADKNTPTALRNSNLANDSCDVPKRSQRKPNVSAKDKTNLNPTNVLDFTAPTSDNTPKDSLDDVNEIINADLQERPDYDIRIERNSYVNRIIITRSADMEYSVKAPHITKDKTPEKSNIRQISKSSSKKPLPPAPTGHLRRDPRLQNAIVLATTGGQPLDLKKDFGNLAKRNQAMPKKPNAEQKVSQVSNGIHFSPHFQNGIQQVSREKRSLARSTTVSVCVDPNAAVQTTTRRTPFAVQNPGPAVNEVRHISELPYPNQSGLVFKACLLQDPRTGVIYLDPPAKPRPQTSYNPRSSVHSMQNILSAVPNVPSLPPGEKQWTPDYRNHTLPTLQGENQTIVRGPLELNNANHRAYVQNTPHNIPPAVRNSNSAAHANCSSLCQYHGPFLPAHSHQEPRMQETMLRKPTEANCRQLSCSESTDNRAFAVLNSTKPNQPIPNGNNSNEQSVPVHISYSNQPQETPIEINKNTVEESGYQRNTVTKPNQPIPNGNTNSVQSSPVHIDYSNQPQETPIEVNKNTVEESGYQRNTVTAPLSASSITKPSQPLKEQNSQNENSLNKKQLKRFSDRQQKAEKQILDNLKGIFTKINEKLDERYKQKNDDIICDKMTKYNEAISKAVVMVTKHCDMRMKDLLSKSKPLETIRKRHCDNDDDDTDGSDYKKESPKKKRYQRRMILPPDYNPKNSRWTLRYKTASSELVELFPRSRVYVNKERLLRITRTAKSCTSLARQLLLEIFSKSALSVCSLTGARSRVTDPDGVNIRPGLDEHARMVLFNFIEDHRIKKDWPKNDMAITLTLRSKLSESRRL